MTVSAASLLVPGYLALCLVLGGGAPPAWHHVILHLAGLLVIGRVITDRSVRLKDDQRWTVVFLAAALALILVQILPLPPFIWTSIPGRSDIAEGYRLLGMTLPWQPFSLEPSATLSTALSLIPPAAILLASLNEGRSVMRLGGLVIVCMALIGVLVGASQLLAGGPYLYAIRNDGEATGFFANSNHHGMLLVVALPFLAAVSGDLRGRLQASQQRWALVMVAAGAALVLGAGVLLNGSLAALILAAPVGMACLWLFLPGRLRHRGWMAVLVLPIAATAVWLAGTGTGGAVSLESRITMASRTLEMVRDSMPFGVGLGAFPSAYPQFEDGAEVDRWFVNHAHNDYLEIAAEAGLPAILLVALFLGWWGLLAVRLWRAASADRYARAGAVATAALIIHSLVDYPLRTDALAAVFAFGLACMMRFDRSGSAEKQAVARHLSLGSGHANG